MSRTAASVFLALTLVLAACTSGPSLNSVPEVANACKVTDDPYTKSLSIAGPRVSSGKYGLGGYLLYATRSGPVKQASLLVSEWRTYQEGWMFLQSAHDSSGRSLPVTVLSRDVEDGGAITEKVRIDFPTNYLADHSAGIDIRLDGTRGSVVVMVPATYINGFITALVASPLAR